MNVKGVLGKRIVKVNQTRFYSTHTMKFEYEVKSIVLEDGTRLVLLPFETDEDPAVDVRVVRPKKESKP